MESVEHVPPNKSNQKPRYHSLELPLAQPEGEVQVLANESSILELPDPAVALQWVTGLWGRPRPERDHVHRLLIADKYGYRQNH